MIKPLAKSMLICLFFAAGSAYAQSGATGEFTIYNSSENNLVISFYTNDGSGWSSNWLNNDLQPGEQASAVFFDDTGPCEQTFQVGWLGEGGSEVLDDEIDIDICEASNIYLEDNEIYFD